MKTFLLTAIAFVALPALSGLMPELHLQAARIDLHLPLVVFLALTGPGIEGAFGAFAIGYLVELHSGHPMGLFLSSSMFTYAIARLFSPLVDPRSRWSFAALILGFDVVYGLIALWLARLSPFTQSGSLRAVLSTSLLTALVAWLSWPLFEAIERRCKKRDRAELRLR